MMPGLWPSNTGLPPLVGQRCIDAGANHELNHATQLQSPFTTAS